MILVNYVETLVGPSLPVPAIICLNMEDKVNSLKLGKTAQKGKITRLETYVQSITEPICEERYREDFPSTVQMLDICFYVDDLISGKDDVPSALNNSITAEKIMQEAGMSLRKWISNSNELMK